MSQYIWNVHMGKFMWKGSRWGVEYVVVVVQSLTRVRLFATPWTAARQASLSFTISWSLLKLMSIESVIPSSHLILCHPFSSCLQSFPASGSFPMNWLFTSGGQSIGASALAPVLPKNIQDWFPLGLTGWISLLSKGLSRIFPSTTDWKYQFFGAQPSSWEVPRAVEWVVKLETQASWCSSSSSKAGRPKTQEELMFQFKSRERNQCSILRLIGWKNSLLVKGDSDF